MRIAKVKLVTLLAVLSASTLSSPAARPNGEPRERPPVSTSCPAVTVSCVDTGDYGRPIEFTANISGGDAAVTPTFNWSVPGFRISGGEGTSAITVEWPPEGGTVKATVVVKGYDPSCFIAASCMTSIIVEPEPRKVDEYGVVAVGDEKQRLNIFDEELQKNPTAEGYLICYGGRRSRANEAQRRCDRALNFLVVSRRIDAARFVTVDGGFREKFTIELWLVPSGVMPPQASPTVDPKEVRPPRPPRKPRSRTRR
jgi:hypothetical protein